MNEDKLRELYVESVKNLVESIANHTELSGLSKSGWEQAIDMVLEVIKQMEDSGFDRTTLEELKQRIV